MTAISPSPFRDCPTATPEDYITHVMIDLETLGNRPGCITASIGAVAFTQFEIIAEFYEVIDPVDAQQRGLIADAATVMWWLKQGDQARAALTDSSKSTLPAALTAFSAWISRLKDPGKVKIWGNGADFDIPVLIAAYHACGLDAPWRFWNHRCFRTLKSLHPHYEPERAGTAHNALDDARHQAKWLQDIANDTKLTLC